MKLSEFDQFLTLLRKYGVLRAQFHAEHGGGGLSSVEFFSPSDEWIVKRSEDVLGEPDLEGDVDDELLTHSAAMPGHDSVYEDPDLYPDGVDPVQSAREHARDRGLAPEVRRGQ